MKILIRQPRPADSPMLGYGMPSSHTQWSFYFAIYTSLIIFKSSSLSLAPKLLIVLCLFVCAVLVGVSRIVLRYHSLSQVLVGGAVGASWAIAWYLFNPTPRIRWVCDTWIGRTLLLRDTSQVEQLLQREYALSRPCEIRKDE